MVDSEEGRRKWRFDLHWMLSESGSGSRIENANKTSLYRVDYNEVITGQKVKLTHFG